MGYIKQPQQIENASFDIIREIIAREYPAFRFYDAWQEKIMLRAIHTSADVDWLDILHFSADAPQRIAEALRQGCNLYTDTTMAMAGINKRELERLGCRIHCYIGDKQVADMARRQGITRSMAAVDLAVGKPGQSLFVFGNAPTALFRLLEHCAAGLGVRPEAVIGVPVGFVGAAESKQALVRSDLPCIAALGRKGGSNIAAAIVNAVLYQLREE